MNQCSRVPHGWTHSPNLVQEILLYANQKMHFSNGKTSCIARCYHRIQHTKKSPGKANNNHVCSLNILTKRSPLKRLKSLFAWIHVWTSVIFFNCCFFSPLIHRLIERDASSSAHMTQKSASTLDWRREYLASLAAMTHEKKGAKWVSGSFLWQIRTDFSFQRSRQTSKHSERKILLVVFK